MANASNWNGGSVDDDNTVGATPSSIPDNQAFTQEFDNTFYVKPVRQQPGLTIPRSNNPPTLGIRARSEARGFYPGLDGCSSVGSRGLSVRRRRGR